MTEIEFIRELDGSYLLVRTDRPGDDFAEKMIMNARPPQLLPMRAFRREEGCEYRYEISGMQSLSNRLAAREIEAAEIRELVRSLYRTLNELEDHLLDTGGLWLEPGLMFRGEGGWRFCYLPGRQEEIYRQMQPLSRFLLKKCSHEDTETAAMAYELFQLCHEENVSFAQLLEAVEPPQPQQEETPPASKASLWRRLFRKHGGESEEQY